MSEVITNTGKNQNEAKHVAIYVSVASSLKAEQEISIDKQITEIREYIGREDWVCMPEHVYIDAGYSGRSVDRPAFQKMITAALHKPRQFDVVVVWKYNRFARSNDDAIFYTKMLRKKCGVEVVSVYETIEDSPFSRVIEGFIELVDEFYSVNLAADCLREMTLSSPVADDQAHVAREIGG